MHRLCGIFVGSEGDPRLSILLNYGSTDETLSVFNALSAEILFK